MRLLFVFVSFLFVPSALHSTLHFYAVLCQMRQKPARGLCEAHIEAVCRSLLDSADTNKFSLPINQLLRIECLQPLNLPLILLSLFYHLNTKEAVAAN